jgi:hypothetical protein
MKAHVVPIGVPAHTTQHAKQRAVTRKGMLVKPPRIAIRFIFASFIPWLHSAELEAGCLYGSVMTTPRLLQSPHVDS